MLRDPWFWVKALAVANALIAFYGAFRVKFYLDLDGLWERHARQADALAEGRDP